MITWPFPQRMSLIRSQWRSHWVCNCFPLGETSTAIESYLTAVFADGCSVRWVEQDNSAVMPLVRIAITTIIPRMQEMRHLFFIIHLFLSVKPTAGQEFACLIYDLLKGHQMRMLLSILWVQASALMPPCSDVVAAACDCFQAFYAHFCRFI